MLPSEALEALDNLPPAEALRRPIEGRDTPANRIASLLGASGKAIEPTTFGDILFRWARTEPDALADADIASFQTLSEMVIASERLPKKLGLSKDFQRALLAGEANVTGQFNLTPRSYMMSRLVAHLHEAQGCETAIGWSNGSPMWLLINGLNFAVHDPNDELPHKVEKPTFFAEDVLNKISKLVNHPFVYTLGMRSAAINSILPANGFLQDVLFDGLDLCAYVGAAAQAGRIVMSRDTDAIMKLSGVASTAVAGHIGHLAGHAAGVALFGLAGSWMVVLAPIGAGLGGRVVARNLMRRARYFTFCRREVSALHDAISRHCSASHNVMEQSIKLADSQSTYLSELYNSSSGAAKDVVGDWLDRLKHIQSYRRLVKAKLSQAMSNPTSLDRLDADPLSAAHESLIICARSGIHPGNVSDSASEVVSAATALHKKMSLVSI
jgi:hypothetical protein